jgi:predicted nucleotidyltransferase
MGTLMLEAFFPKVKRKILILFFTHPDEDFHLREIVRRIHGGRGAVERELKTLTEAGILIRKARGNMVCFQANRHSPVFREIQSLIVKTAGVADVVRSSILNLEGIRFAFIFGSTASGEMDTLSDVDVFIIGDVTFTEVSAALFAVEDVLGRKVTPVVYSLEEFASKASEEHHFIKRVLSGPIIVLIGVENDLRAVGQQLSG